LCLSQGYSGQGRGIGQPSASNSEIKCASMLRVDIDL